MSPFAVGHNDPKGFAAEPAPPTQVRHPWRAALRTFAQTWIGGAIGFLVAWPLIEPAIRGYVDTLPPYLGRVVVPLVTAIAGLAGLVAKLMAVPTVNAWLTARGLGAGKRTN